MPLWFIKEKDPVLTYALWTGVVSIYNQWLRTPPRIYGENIKSVGHFFYEPGGDILVAYAWFNNAYWPGWSFSRLEFDAETGELINRLSQIGGYGGDSYSSGVCLGSFGKLYSTFNPYPGRVRQVEWDTLYEQTNGWAWQCPDAIKFAAVNLEDGLIVGVDAWTAKIYTNITTTNDVLMTFRLPESIDTVSYEDRGSIWISTSTGQLLKLNYRPNPRWTILASVTDPPEDALGYKIAFDTKRKRLAVMIPRPDSEDGTCRLKIQFYRPLIKVDENGLTDPVPVTLLEGGKMIRFVSHIHGAAGEGIGGFRVDAALDSPAEGALINNSASSVQNGAVHFSYKSAETGSPGETLRLSASISEGE